MSPHTKEFILNESTLHTIVTQSELDMPLVNISYKTHFTPQDSVFAFDLHGVIFHPSITQIIKILWKTPHKWHLLNVIFNVRIVYNALAAIITKKVIEQFINSTADKYAVFKPIKPLVLELVNAQKPAHKMIAILQALKQQGYTLIAFSNIGDKSIELLSTKFPAVFSLFDHTINTSVTDGYIAKPSPKAFKKLLDIVPKNKKVLFVDDTFNNIIHANAHGIYTIPFLNIPSFETMLRESKIL
jgi:FMN phosphatase YigB (HAD superfamily)